MTGGVVVVGSANVDMVSGVDRIPGPGETVTATSFAVHPGGKGLNQAVAARRSGATTTFVGAVGDDDHGALLLQVLAETGIPADRVRRTDQQTGLALVTTDILGENNIVVVPGANGVVTSLSDQDRAVVRAAAVLVCQLEIPMTAVADAIRTAADAGTTVVLNPSPVRDLPPEILSAVDVLVVNEHEAEQLQVDTLDIPAVVTTLGPWGARLARRGVPSVQIPARRTVAVDSTGAGDTFVGVLAAEIAAGVDIEVAAQRAGVAGSLSVEIPGAVPSIPTRQDIDDVLRTEMKSNL
ncbi:MULTISPECIES: ribokinase [unclassified Microbacterium]|uniref:ribokinase n=1 Tax=unclassified Microbacterium TaxID=2609290 RepID=UPI0036582AA8